MTRMDEVQKELENLQAQKHEATSQVSSMECQIKDLESANSELKDRIVAREKDANILNEKLWQKDSIVKDLGRHIGDVQVCGKARGSRNPLRRQSDE